MMYYRESLSKIDPWNIKEVQITIFCGQIFGKCLFCQFIVYIRMLKTQKLFQGNNIPQALLTEFLNISNLFYFIIILKTLQNSSCGTKSPENIVCKH